MGGDPLRRFLGEVVRKGGRKALLFYEPPRGPGEKALRRLLVAGPRGGPLALDPGLEGEGEQVLEGVLDAFLGREAGWRRSLLADLKGMVFHMASLERVGEREVVLPLGALLRRSSLPALPDFLPPLEAVREEGWAVRAKWGTPLCTTTVRLQGPSASWPDWILRPLLEALDQAFPHWKGCRFEPQGGTLTLRLEVVKRREVSLSLHEALEGLSATPGV